MDDKDHQWPTEAEKQYFEDELAELDDDIDTEMAEMSDEEFREWLQ